MPANQAAGTYEIAVYARTDGGMLNMPAVVHGYVVQ
jgi:hypothetical protein